MSFAIETGAPVTAPINSGRPVGNGKYPFRNLKKGQSFLVADKTKARSLASLCVHFRHKLGHTFCIRTEPNGIRVHRIK